MAASEWMELENLSSEIANSISRLEAAKLVGSNGLAQVIEKEIAALEERRSRLLANIASSVVGNKGDGDQNQPESAAEPEAKARSEPEPDPPPQARPADETRTDPRPEPESEETGNRHPVQPAIAAAEEFREPPQQPALAPEFQKAEMVAPVTGGAPEPPRNEEALRRSASPPEPSRYEEPPRRGGASWNQLTPADVERAQRDLNQRRIETLARHAAELRALDADQEDIDVLERAIEVFTRKFAVQQPAGAEVVRLEPERGARRSVG